MKELEILKANQKKEVESESSIQVTILLVNTGTRK